MIGHNLTSLRKFHRMSQEDVAEQIGVSRQAVAKWEAGTTSPDINNCVALAKLYQVSVDNLINYSEETLHVPMPPRGKHLFGIVTLGEKGQIVIPKKAREIFDLKAGDKIVVLGDEEQGIALTKASTLMNFYETLKGEAEEEN